MTTKQDHLDQLDRQDRQNQPVHTVSEVPTQIRGILTNDGEEKKETEEENVDLLVPKTLLGQVLYHLEDSTLTKLHLVMVIEDGVKRPIKFYTERDEAVSFALWSETESRHYTVEQIVLEKDVKRGSTIYPVFKHNTVTHDETVLSVHLTIEDAEEYRKNLTPINGYVTTYGIWTLK